MDGPPRDAAFARAAAAADAYVAMHRDASTPRNVHDLSGALAHEQERDMRDRVARFMAFVYALYAELQLSRACESAYTRTESDARARAGTLAAPGTLYGAASAAVDLAPPIEPEF